MNCSQIQKLLQAHHDGELDAANTLLVDEHLADCPQCFATLRQLSSLRVAVRQEGLRFSASSDLRSSIRAAVSQTAAAERESVETPRARESSWTQYLGWAAAVVALGISLTFVQFSLTRREGEVLLGQLTACHVRSLMAGHLTDVASTDQHTVKPWFDGKLDFAPPVRDLKESGFPLLGGRLDYVDGRPAAALIYGRNKHLLNLFVWPSKSAEMEGLKTAQRNGYNIARWSDGKMNYGAVSDLSETDLRVFVADWTGR